MKKILLIATFMTFKIAFGQWQSSNYIVEISVKGENIIIDTTSKVTLRMDQCYIKLGNDSCISSNSIYINDTLILLVSYDVYKNKLQYFEFYYINQLGYSVKLVTEDSFYKLPIYTKKYFIEIGISTLIDRGKFYSLNQLLNPEKFKGENYLSILNFEKLSY